jgi:hypothetical protein
MEVKEKRQKNSRKGEKPARASFFAAGLAKSQLGS